MTISRINKNSSYVLCLRNLWFTASLSKYMWNSQFPCLLYHIDPISWRLLQDTQIPENRLPCPDQSLLSKSFVFRGSECFGTPLDAAPMHHRRAIETGNSHILHGSDGGVFGKYMMPLLRYFTLLQSTRM